jgi:hypothetical protein
VEAVVVVEVVVAKFEEVAALSNSYVREGAREERDREIRLLGLDGGKRVQRYFFSALSSRGATEYYNSRDSGPKTRQDCRGLGSPSSRPPGSCCPLLPLPQLLPPLLLIPLQAQSLPAPTARSLFLALFLTHSCKRAGRRAGIRAPSLRARVPSAFA